MNNNQTDNSRTKEKLEMRTKICKEGMKILDCYHGNGILWGEIEKKKNIKIYGIEKEKGKGSRSIYGECEKVIPSLNLKTYDIIDFDAYGSPYKAIKALFQNKTAKKGTVCFYTYIQTGMGSVETEILRYVGITPNMRKKCPTLFRGYGFTAFKSFLYEKGIRQIENVYFHDKGSDKNYGYFYI